MNSYEGNNACIQRCYRFSHIEYEHSFTEHRNNVQTASERWKQEEECAIKNVMLTPFPPKRLA